MFFLYFYIFIINSFIPGIGDFVMFKDTEGNRVSMLQMDKK